MQLPPRWVVAVSLGVAAAILGDSLLYAVLPTQWPHLGLEVGMVGVLLSANRLVRLASNPVAGWVVGRWGLRGPFLAAVFAAAGTTAAYALGLGFVVLLVARSLWGVCWSFLRLGGYLAALEASGDGNRAYYLGFFYGVTRLGSFVAVLVGGLLTDLLGFQATVWLFATATLVGGLGVLREHPPGTESHLLPARTDGRPVEGAVPFGIPEERLEPASDSLARFRLWAAYTGAFFHSMAVSGLVTATLGLWLLTLYGSSAQAFFLTLGVATTTGALLSARFLSDFLWGPLSGHLSDRRGRVPLALLAAVIEGGAFFGLAAGGTLMWTAGAALVLFLSATAFQVTMDATAGDLASPAVRARTMSWYATWSDLGAALGPLVGYLVGTGIGLEWMYRGAAALLMLMGLAYVAMFRARPVVRRQESAAQQSS